MPITILAVGKKHESWVKEGIERYEKRLKKPMAVEWVLIPHSKDDGDQARREESDHITKKIKNYDYSLLLDERGILLNSVDIATRIGHQLEQAKSIVIIIGGAYGVTDQLRQLCDTVWSLSLLVYPHQLVRLIVAEQLYRTQQILLGGPYHHQ